MTPTPIFINRRYPPGLSLHRRFVKAGTQPVIFALTPVMIIIMMMALLSQPIDWMMRYGAPLAVAVAAVWTCLQLARTPATVAFKDGLIRVQSALEISSRRRKSGSLWGYVIDLQKSPQTLRATIGHTAYEFLKADWEDFPALVTALESSRLAFVDRLTLDAK